MSFILFHSFFVNAQDLSLSLSTVGDTQLCSDSAIPSFDVTFTANDFAVDLRNKNLSLSITGATSLPSFTMTIPNIPRFNVATNTTAVLRIDDETTENYPISLQPGVSSIAVSITIAGDIDSSNNSSSQAITYILPNTPVISSEPAGFSYCVDDPVIFKATGGNEGDTYYWRFADDILLTGEEVTKTAGSLSNGEIVKLYLVTSEGCSSTLVTQELTINDSPQISLTTDPVDETICRGDNITVTVTHDNYISGNTIYRINGGDVTLQKIEESNSTTFDIFNIQAETLYDVEVQDIIGCSASTSFTIKVPLVEEVGVISTNFNGIICSSDKINDTIYGDGTNGSIAADQSNNSSVGSSIEYIWQWKKPNSENTWSTFPGSGNTQNLANTILSAQTLTEDIVIRRLVYAVNGTDRCLVDATYNELQFTVYTANIPEIKQVSDDYNLCASDDSLTLQADNGELGDEYHWYKNGSFQSSSTNNFFTVQSEDISSNATYGVKIVNPQGCESSIATKTISINPPIEIVLSTNKPGNVVCEGDSFSLTVSLTNELNGQYTYIYDTGGQAANATNQGGTTTFLFNNGVQGETTINVRAIDTDGCSAYQNIIINVPRIGNGGSIATSHSGVLCFGDGIDQAIIGDGTLAGSATATLAVDSSTASIVYEWELKGDSDGDWRTVAGSSNTINLSASILSTLDIEERTRFRRLSYAKIGSVKCLRTDISFPEIAFEVETPRNLILSTSDNSICDGEQTIFNASGVLNGDIYEWRLNGVTKETGTSDGSSLSYTADSQEAIIGINKVELIVSPPTITCSTTVSSTFTLNESPEVSLDTNLDADVVCDGSTVNLIATVQGGLTGNYVFKINNTYTPPQASNIYTISDDLLSQSENIIEVVFTADTSTCSSSISSLTIQKISNVPGQIQTGVTDYCVGDIPSNITSVAPGTPSNPNSNDSYYWESSPNADFTEDVSTIISNTTTLSFSVPIVRTTYFRRAFVSEIDNVECVEYSNIHQLRVFSLDGGEMNVDSLLECDLTGPLNTYEIIVNDNNPQAAYVYQWQQSTDGGVTWTNAPATAPFTNTDETYTLTATKTTAQYRRQISAQPGSPCNTPAFSEIFSYTSVKLVPGQLNSSFSGTYCYGSDPPVLGTNSAVAVPAGATGVVYQWQVAYKNSPIFQEADFVDIPNATFQSYDPPTLNNTPTQTHVAYRRGVRIDEIVSNDCVWSYTTPVIFSVLQDYDWGYIDVQSPRANPRFPYCEGDVFPNLFLMGVSPDARRLLNNNAVNLNVTWEMSRDQKTWNQVNDITGGIEDDFTLRNDQSNDINDQFYLSPTNEMYFRAHIVYTNSNLQATDFINTNQTSAQQIRLLPAPLKENNLDIGESYLVFIADSSSVSVTVTAENNTTDQIGSELASAISSADNNYQAEYFSNSNVINLTTNQSFKEISVTVIDDTNTASIQKSLGFKVTEQTFSSSVCEWYTEVFHIDVDQRPTISFSGGSDQQIRCDGEDFDPLHVTWSGTGSLTITNWDNTFSINRNGALVTNGNTLIIGPSDTNSITITGSASRTVTSSNNFTFRIDSNCGDATQSVTRNFIFTVNPSAPTIGGLFRDNIDHSGGKYREVRNNNNIVNGQQIDYNDVVVVDPLGNDNQTIDLYVCFDEVSLGFGGLNWGFSINPAETYSTTEQPAFFVQSLYDEVYEYEEEGARIRLNKNFFPQGDTTQGAYVDVTIRASQTCDEADGPTSTFTLYFLNAEQSNTGNLSTLTSPAAINEDFCDFDTNPVPLCEILTGFAADIQTIDDNPTNALQDPMKLLYTDGPYYTQFFSASTDGINNFASLNWQIQANGGAWSNSSEAGSISSDGLVTWDSGFYGTVQIRVAPMTASGTIDISKYSYSNVFTIGQVDETIPIVLATNPPLCPIPNSDDYIKEIKSFGLDVNYTAVPNGASFLYNPTNLGTGEGISITYNGVTQQIIEGVNANTTVLDLINEINANGNSLFGSAISLEASIDAFNSYEIDISLTESSTTNTETVKGPGNLVWEFGTTEGVVFLEVGDDETVIAEKLASKIDNLNEAGFSYRASSNGSKLKITESVSGNINQGTSNAIFPSFSVSTTADLSTVDFQTGVETNTSVNKSFNFTLHEHQQQGMLIKVTNNSNSVSLSDAGLSLITISGGEAFNTSPTELISSLNQFTLASIDTEFNNAFNPNNGVVTSTFSIKNGADIDWYILRDGTVDQMIVDNIGLAASVTQYQSSGYYLVNGNSGTLNKDLTITWASGATGTFIIKAVPKGCSGTRPEWVADYQYEIPPSPSINRILTDPASTTQIQFCEGQNNFVNLSYEIRAKDISDIIITDHIDPTSSLGDSFNYSIIPQSQQTTITVQGEDSDFVRTYIIQLNDDVFSLNVPLDQSQNTTAQDFLDLIKANDKYDSSRLVNGNQIEINSDPGVYFDIQTHATGKINLQVNKQANQVHSILEINGVSVLEPGFYRFSIDLVLGDSYCVQQGQELFTVDVYDDLQLIHDDSQGAKDQVICFNGQIDPIVWDITGKDDNEDDLIIRLSGDFPELYITDVQPDWISDTPQYKITSSGVSSTYWNTRNFSFQVISENENCADVRENINLTIYPQDFLRTSTVTPSISQQLCEGVAIQPIYYEFWGTDQISATIEDNNDLNLNYVITNRAQVASITFRDIWPTESSQTNRNEVYRIYLNDILYEHHINQNTPPAVGTNITPQSILQSLADKINADNNSPASVVLSPSDLNGNGIDDYFELLFTAKVPGITFSIDAKTFDAVYIFNEPKMITAPKLIKITGTPTVDISNITDVQSYTFNITTLGSNYCDNSKPSASVTYTLQIEAQPNVEVTSDYPNITVCDGYTENSIDFTVYRGSGFEISTTSTNTLLPFYPGFGSTVTPVFINESFYKWSPDVVTNVETITTFTYTVTPTGNQCGISSSSVTGTITVIPHYINHIQFTGAVSQTVCESENIIPIEYKWSGNYSSYNILWENGLNPGLSVSSTSNTLTLSGTIEVPETITSLTSYKYQIEIDGDYYSGGNCNTLVVTGTIQVVPKSKISITSNPETLNQIICDGNTMETIQFFYENGASNYEINWSPRKPQGLSLSPIPESISPGTATITLSGLINTDVVSRTVYNYTITTLNNVNGCEEASISGSITVYPSEDKFLLSNAGNSSFCFGDYISLDFEFKGIPQLLLTEGSSLPDGLTVTKTYTLKAKSEFTITGSTVDPEENYQFNLINYNGLTSTSYTFTTTSTTLTANQLAANIAASISNENVQITSENNVITFEANEADYSFLVTHNSSGAASITLSKFIQNRGVISITGTPTTDIYFPTTYTYGVKTPGLYCSSHVVTNTITLSPKSYVALTSDLDTQYQDVCDGTTIETVKFFLSGAATNYTIDWSNGIPNGLLIQPVPGGASSSNSTITLSGLINTGVSSRTVYPYVINTISADGSCEEATIEGSITVYPSEDKFLLSRAGDSSSCFGEFVELQYEFQGISGLTITEGSTIPNGLNLITTYTQSPSIRVNVSGSSSESDIYSFKIIEGDLGERNYNYLPKGVKNASTIATDISRIIDDSQVEVTVVNDSNLIFSSKSDDYVFNLSFASSGTADLVIEEYKPVQGVLSITGTPTSPVFISTDYTIGISTSGLYCDAFIVTSTLTINPKSYIDLNSALGTDSQILCDGTSINDIQYLLKGGASNHEIIWPQGQPAGILVSPASGALSPGNTTISLTGTLDTGVTTTTIYPYQINTIGNINNCDESTVYGSITVLPKAEIELASNSAPKNQEVCSGVRVQPIIFDFIGGTSGATLQWIPSDPGINWNTTSRTLTISGTVDASNITETTTYNYLITTFGNGCEAETIAGELIIHPEINLSAVSPTLLYQRDNIAICENSPIQEIIINVEGVSSYGASGNVSWTSSNYLDNIVVSQSDSKTFILKGNAIPVQDITEVTEFTFDFIVSSFGSCQEPKKLSGSIEVIPLPEIKTDFIQSNDVTDVLCYGEASGSITIPLTPYSELVKRITGSTLSEVQIEKLIYEITDPDTSNLDLGDQLGVTINDQLFVYTYGAGNTNYSLDFGISQLISQINRDIDLKVTATLRTLDNDQYIELASDIPGISFTVTTTNYPITSTVTTTASLINLRDSRLVGEQFNWFLTENEVTPFTTGNELFGLQAGTYYLEVLLSGCNSERVPIVVNQPSAPLELELLACDTSLEVDLSGGTPPYRVELFREDKVSSSVVTLTNVDTQIISTGTNYIFTNLLPTQSYHVEVYDFNGCYDSQNIVIPESLVIDTNKVIIINDPCTEQPINIGEGAIQIINNGPFPITGGSGQYSYSWTGVTASSEVSYNSANITDLLPGIYTLTVTDIVLGCSSTAQFQIQAPPALEITYTPFTTTTEDWFQESEGANTIPVDRLISLNCPDETANIEISVSGALDTTQVVTNTTLGAFSIDWFKNGNQLLSGVDRITDQGPGIYKAVAYLQSDPTCSVSYSFEVRRPEEYSIEVISLVNATCNDDKAQLVVEIIGGKPNSGPYQLIFNDGLLAGSSSGEGERRITFSNIDPLEINQLSNYQVIDNLNCSPIIKPISVIFDLPEQVEESPATVVDIDCANNQLGSIKLNLSGFLDIDDIYVKWTVDIEDPLQPGYIKYLPWNSSGLVDSNGNVVENGSLFDISYAGNYSYEIFNEATGCNISSGQVQVKETSGNQIIMNDIVVTQPGCNGVTGSIVLDLDLSSIEGIPTITWEKFVTVNSLISSPTGLTSETISDVEVQQWQEISAFQNNTSALDLQQGTYRATIQDEGENCDLTRGRAIRTRAILIGSQSLDILNTRIIENIPENCSEESLVTASFEFTVSSNIQNQNNIEETYIIELSGASNGLIYSNSSSQNVLASNVNYSTIGQNHSFSGLAPDTYNLVVTRLSDNNGCSVAYNFVVNEYIPLQYNGDTEFIIDSCNGTAEITADISGGVPFIINGNPTYQYSWVLRVKKDGAFTGNSINYVGETILVDQAGELTLTVTDSNGCFITLDSTSLIGPISVDFDFEPFRLIPILTNEQGEKVFSLAPSCTSDIEQNGSIGFNVEGGNDPYNVYWYLEDPINGNTENPHRGYVKLDYQNQTIINTLEPGNYKIVIESLETLCDDSEQQIFEQIINVPANKDLFILDGPYVDEDLCRQLPGRIIIDIFDNLQGDLSFVYNGEIINKEEVIKLSDRSFMLLVTEPVKEAELLIQNINGCQITTNVSLGVGEPSFKYTSTNLEATGTILAREEVSFENTSTDPFVQSEWIFGDNSPSLFVPVIRDSIIPVRHEYGISGTYFTTLRIYNDLGCTEEYVEPIVIGKGYNIMIPNVFTPNGDLINDVFKPVFSGLSLIEFSVYDNLGNLVYSEIKPEDGIPEVPDEFYSPINLEGWNGETIYDAPYYIYTIRGRTLFGDKEVIRNGTFLIIR